MYWVKMTDYDITKRNQWAKTPEEKLIFFEDWTVENIKRIANLFARNALHPIHTLAIDSDMLSLIRQQQNTPLDDSELNNLIYKYWYARAYRVLTKYSEYKRPILDTDKKTLIAYEPINILSSRGLDLLKQLSENKPQSIDTLLSVAHKHHLDLDLFITPKMSPSDFETTEFKFLSPVSGCYNNCPHCAVNAQPFVYCMPYPIILKILYLFGKKEVPTYVGLHDDSEDISYFDPVLRADFGDLAVASIKKNVKITILSKGLFLGSRIDLAVSKYFYSEKNPCSIKTSLLLIKQEEAQKNFAMVEGMKQIAAIYGRKDYFHVRLFTTPKLLSFYTERIKALPGKKGTLFWAAIEPFGRAANLKEAYTRYSLEEIQALYKKTGFTFDMLPTNVIPGFCDVQYLKDNGHMQLSAFGYVTFKGSEENRIYEQSHYDIYNRAILNLSEIKSILKQKTQTRYIPISRNNQQKD